MSGTIGIIEEVSTDGENHQFCATIGVRGFEGDKSGTPGIVLLNADVPHFINQEFGSVQILAGQLGDNILVQGLGDLVDIPPGTIIRIRKVVELRVIARATHYRKMFSKVFSEDILSLLDRRGGVTCEVVTGVGVRVCDHDEVEILDTKSLVHEVKSAA